MTSPLELARNPSQRACEKDRDQIRKNVTWAIKDGFVFCQTDRSYGPEVQKLTGKVSFHSPQGLLAAFGPSHAFIVRFKPTLQNKVHPTHGSSEIYREVVPGEGGFVELEHHGAYVKLKSGESMTRSETWSIVPADGGMSPAEHRAFLRRIFAGNRIGK